MTFQAICLLRNILNAYNVFKYTRYLLSEEKKYNVEMCKAKYLRTIYLTQHFFDSKKMVNVNSC